MMNNLKHRIGTALGNERGETISSLAIGSLVSTVITLAVSATMVGMIAVQHKVEERTQTATGYASVEHSIRDALTWASDIPSAEARTDRFTTISTGIGSEDDCQASTWSKAGYRLTLTQQTYPAYSFHPTSGMPICQGVASLTTDSVISTDIPEDSQFIFISAQGKNLTRDGNMYRDEDSNETRIAGVRFEGENFRVHQIASRLTPENAHSIETGFVDGDDRGTEAKPGEVVALETAGVMKTLWDLKEAPRGTCERGERMITLPLRSRGEDELKADIYWGDGKRTDERTLTHCYEATEGKKHITVIGEVPSYGVTHQNGEYTGAGESVRSGQMRVNRALIEVEEFTEELKTTTLDLAFAGAENLTRVSNIPKTVASMNLTFFEGGNPTFGAVDMSNVFTLRGAFRDNTKFDQNLNGWKTGKVTDIQQMFDGATKYNQPMNRWDVRKVVNAKQAFAGATKMNQSLRSWDVQKIERFDSMLSGATNYSERLSNWNPRSAKSWDDFAKDTKLEQKHLPEKFRDPVIEEPAPSPSPSPSPTATPEASPSS
ncbi:BspA family leucine-rich repeat surface protein [Glutamicibacter ardleyensis]|uniref:BspA family leucine-rich repeat surface protein n=1 Tax=Glutamicibacter ardleyensis TaxID=225894 RepID=UPI003FD2150C